jgi:hypothetical protein
MNPAGKAALFVPLALAATFLLGSPLIAQDWAKLFVEAARRDPSNDKEHQKPEEPADDGSRRVQKEDEDKKDEDSKGSIRFVPRSTQGRSSSARATQSRPAAESSARYAATREGSEETTGYGSQLLGKPSRASNDSTSPSGPSGVPRDYSPQSTAEGNDQGAVSDDTRKKVSNSRELMAKDGDSGSADTTRRSASSQDAKNLVNSQGSKDSSIADLHPPKVGQSDDSRETSLRSARPDTGGRDSLSVRPGGRTRDDFGSDGKDETSAENSDGKPKGTRETLDRQMSRVGGKTSTQTTDPNGVAKPEVNDSGHVILPKASAGRFAAQITSAAGNRKAEEGRLQPRISENLQAALTDSRSRELPLLVAVGVGVPGTTPELFLNPAVARSSRLNLSLSVVSGSDENILRTIGVLPEQAPCYAVLDSTGNLAGVHRPGVDPQIILGACRNAQAVMRSIQEEAPHILERARQRNQAGDLPGLLSVSRPWLARRYRGNESLDEVVRLVTDAGKDLLDRALLAPSADRVAELKRVASDYVGTRLEGTALLELAKFHQKEGNVDEAKATLKQIVDTLVGPDNEETVRQARALLKDSRKEAIQRRLEEMERRKKMAEQGKK